MAIHGNFRAVRQNIVSMIAEFFNEAENIVDIMIIIKANIKIANVITIYLSGLIIE